MSGSDGFVVGVSGGIDSAVTSILCAETHKKSRAFEYANTPKCA
jgi:NH3-dependent NAD+ synthetase